MDIEQKAKEFATMAHGCIDHKRKYTGEPYINHPAEVVEIVRKVCKDPEVLAAAWLHDVVEDTPVRPELKGTELTRQEKLDIIEQEFGKRVAGMVDDLSDIAVPSDGNRKARTAINREHAGAGSSDSKTVKLADILSNNKSIIKDGIDFAVVYIPEMKLLLEKLTQGNPILYKMATDSVQNSFEKVEEYKEEIARKKEARKQEQSK